MFDLEQAISEWRKQMLKAGVKNPVPLEELESHLREEIEQGMKSGLAPIEVFETAVRNVGEPAQLKAEFARAAGFSRWLGNGHATVADRILGPSWLIEIVWMLFPNLRTFAKILPHPEAWSSVGFVFLILVVSAGTIGVFGSCAAFAGVDLGRKILKTGAMLGLALFMTQIWFFGFRSLTFMAYALTILNLVTIFWLRPPGKTKLADS